MHKTMQQSDIRSECVFLNYDHGTQQALLCEYVDLGSHSTYVILDSGCTRAMISRFAIDQVVQACQRHPKRYHIWFSTQPCTSKFSFANGEQSTVKERLVIHFRNDHAQNGWITTCVDIVNKGKVPILFSVEQMRNLRMNIEHTPVGEFLTCPLFGMQRTALLVSTSNHPVLDVMALATSSWKPMCRFASEETTCPACAWKHRPRTYKEGCKKKPITTKEDLKPAKTTTAKSVLKKILSPDTKLEVPEKSLEESTGEVFRTKFRIEGWNSCTSGTSARWRTRSEDWIKGTYQNRTWKRIVIQRNTCTSESSWKASITNRAFETPFWSIITCRLNSSRKELQLWSWRRTPMTSMIKLSSPMTPVPRQRLHHLVLRFQESGVKFLENLVSLIMEKFQLIQNPSFNFFWFTTVQLLWPLHTLCKTELIPWRDTLTISHLQEYFETYQLNPKYIVADQAFMGIEMEEYYSRQNIRPISLGPGTPWPNRAEAAIRMFKRQVFMMLTSLKDDPLLANFTYRQLVRQACISRNSMITHGGVTPVECRHNGDWKHYTITAHDWGPCSWEPDWSAKITGYA